MERATRTIGQWIKAYCTDNAHLVSIKSRGASLRMVLGPLLKSELGALNRTWLIQRCNDLLAGGYRGRTVQTYRTNVVMLVTWIVDRDGLARSPFRKMPTVPIDRRIKFLEEEDILRLERWCKGAADLKLACFAMIGLYGGLRRGEILSLQRAEIHLTGSRPFIYVLAAKAKSKRGREVPLHENLRDFLTERLPQLPERDPFRFRGVDKRFAHMVAEAGLEVRATPHTLRHSCGSDLVRKGASIVAVKELFGHADLQTTSIYLHAGRKDVVDAVRVLNLRPSTSMMKPLP